MQRGDKLVVLLQSEAGYFSETLENISIAHISLAAEKILNAEVFCTVGDFNGDAHPDVMVTMVGKS